MVQPRYLSTVDFCRYASISRNTLQKWIGSGLPCYRLGRCVRIDVEEFREWIRPHRMAIHDASTMEDIWSDVLEEVAA